MIQLPKILFLLLFPFIVHAREGSFIISGFDDVLRQSHNTSLFRATLKMFKGDRTFTGMPELYQTLSSTHPDPKFIIVSAIPNWFDRRIENFLNKNDYPTHKSFLRNVFIEWSIHYYKIRRIKEFIDVHREEKFLVILDDSDPSIELSKILQRFPEIQAIYLHSVSGKNRPQGVRSYYSAFDIAFQEFQSGRMLWEEVEKIGSAIVKETNRENLFPSYALCPKTYETCKDKLMCLSVSEHIKKLCNTPLAE